jgi:hypothetical protein
MPKSILDVLICPVKHEATLRRGRNAVERHRLNLKNLSVSTEAATGAYRYTAGRASLG